ncbi:TatD family hydrolase [Ignicoccus pacificus DSM 13166]|uniref:TatD family hydrolase n=1 Tax=Ignicoccus pacificus DSM 13166 TaxID=940294 RepID=A0A977K9V3_9CREN|nr:TatD family hydrolase [Ignicoccus pacificus DSM 13166]
MVPIADAHTHTNPVRGLGMEKIAPKFKEAGGWFLAIVGLSPWHYGIEGNLEGYEKTLELTIKECEKARSYGLKVSCLYGFHPADVDKHLGSMKPEEVLDFGMKVMDLVEKAVKEGRLQGVGEVGRQHYKTNPISVVIAEHIMDRAIEISKDYDVVVHLHLEQGGRVSALDVKERVRRIGAKSERVIMHHARGKTLKAAVELGVPATAPGVKGSLEKALELPPNYMVESDHIDDPKRPGIVIYPWEMAKVQLELLNEEKVSEDYLYKLNVENVVRSFSVSPP